GTASPRTVLSQRGLARTPARPKAPLRRTRRWPGRRSREGGERESRSQPRVAHRVLADRLAGPHGAERQERTLPRERPLQRTVPDRVVAEVRHGRRRTRRGRDGSGYRERRTVAVVDPRREPGQLLWTGVQRAADEVVRLALLQRRGGLDRSTCRRRQAKDSDCWRKPQRLSDHARLPRAFSPRPV